MIRIQEVKEESLEGYNDILKQLFVEEKMDVLDEAITTLCGVKLRNVDRLTPILRGICESFHQDQVTLRM